MTFGRAPGPEILSQADVEASLAELSDARQRPYFDADADREAAAAYYGSVDVGDLDELARLVTRTHDRTPVYKPARELYPWIDLHPAGNIRSLYTGQEWDPEELIRADVEVSAQRAEAVTSALARPGVRDAAEVESEVEAALPYNCEHVVPQSWFGKKEPMRGDLHHLFACESRCNSFRGNTPYTEFADFPAAPSAGPGVSVVRNDCGKSESNGFEPAHGKGAASRAVFYFLLRYPGVVDPQEMARERRTLLLTWHRDEPVDEWERHRNAAIFERQGNRNPFIDHPDLAAALLPDLP
jgi:endonuclease G